MPRLTAPTVPQSDPSSTVDSADERAAQRAYREHRANTAAERDERQFNCNRRRLRSWVRRCRDLTGCEQVIILEIIDLANAGDRYAWPGYRWLRRELGAAFSTISSAISKAEKLGVLRVHQVATRTGTGNTYHLQFDVLGDAARGENVVRLDPFNGVMQAPSKRSRNWSRGAPYLGAETKTKLKKQDSCTRGEDPQPPDRGAELHTVGEELQLPDHGAGQSPLASSERGCPPEVKVMTEEEVTKRVNGLIGKSFQYLGENYAETVQLNWLQIEPVVTDAIRDWRQDGEILENLIRPLILERHAAPARSATG